jgi:hypothetical protein
LTGHPGDDPEYPWPAAAPEKTPPRRNHWIRNTILVIAGTAVAGLAIGGSARALSSSHPSPVPLPSVSSPAAQQGAMPAWCAGPGDAALRTVQADLGRVGADARNSDPAGAAADGSQLTTAAEAAEKLPPPVTQEQKVSYVEAMGALSFAGIDLGAGDVAAAVTAAGAASAYLGKDKGILNCP